MTTIRDVLRGTYAGRMQSVGYMQVIPLCSKLQDERFAAPDALDASTVSYGSVVFNNISDEPVIVPSHLTYVVKQRAQDHALCGASVLKSRERRRYDRAACVEQTQGGYIARGKHSFAILPFPLREAALAKRRDKSYSKLWKDISVFNSAMGLPRGSGHLKAFLSHFEKELDQFVAEFENVARQVGAIMLVNGRVVGIERTPSTAYWQKMWQPLVRECYGALALKYTRDCPRPVITRRPMDVDGVSTLANLRAALNSANAREDGQVKAIIRKLVDEDFSVEVEEAVLDFKVETLKHRQFTGQTICEGTRVLYASFVATKDWVKNANWHNSKGFVI